MDPRALVAIGTGQLVNWGVLYYAFAVLLAPVQRELGVPQWMVAGAFSFSLFVSAGLAPAVGRSVDRGRGPQVMVIGGIAAAALLLVWAAVPTVATTYLVWSGLGACMAATLYEPTFAIIARAHRGNRERLRSLASVTVFGGVASTVFLPLTDSLVRAVGWRSAVAVLACVVIVSTTFTWVVALRLITTVPTVDEGMPIRRSDPEADRDSWPLPYLMAVFSLTTLASAGFMANLVPALETRSVSATLAATFGGLLGLMQLPGRVLMMKSTFLADSRRLLAASLALQAIGFVLLAANGSAPGIAVGISAVAMGAGLTTLARPHLVQTLFDGAGIGTINGRLARGQQLARACGPFVVSWLGTLVGFTAIFAAFGVMFAAIALGARRTLPTRTPAASIRHRPTGQA